MAVSTRFPTANEIETGGWTDPNNAHADDGVYATAAPAKNGVVGTRWKTFGFDGIIPAGATITKVQLIYEYKVSTTTSIATMRVRARISDVDEENHDDTSEPTADTVITVDVTADRSWVRADLLDAALKVTGEARRGNSNTAVTFSLDQIKVEVTYSVDRRGLVTWTELETGLPPRRGLYPWVELETGLPSRRGFYTWGEFETPATLRRALLTWAEFETGLPSRRGLYPWGEFETGLPPRRGIYPWTEFETPSVGGGDVWKRIYKAMVMMIHRRRARH